MRLFVGFLSRPALLLLEGSRHAVGGARGARTMRRVAELSTGLYTGRTTHSGLHRDARAAHEAVHADELPREELVLARDRLRADRRAIKYIRPGVPDVRLPKHAVAVAGDRDGRETADQLRPDALAAVRRRHVQILQVEALATPVR